MLSKTSKKCLPEPLEKRLKKVEPKRNFGFDPFLCSKIEQIPRFYSILEQIQLVCFFQFPYNKTLAEVTAPWKGTCSLPSVSAASHRRLKEP